jgi:hypothetical protein
VISSHAPAAADLRVDRCTDLQCSGFSTQYPLTENQGEASSMVAINDLPIIVSYSPATKNLEVVSCLDAACVGFDVNVVATNVGANSETAMAVISGLPAIAYYDSAKEDVEYILCLDVACATYEAHKIDGAGQDLGRGISLTPLGEFGLPAMSYQDADNNSLLFARCATYQCSGTPTVHEVDGVANVGAFTSIVSGSDGYAWIAYYDNVNTSLRFADCENNSCSVVDVLTVDGAAAGMGVGSQVVMINLDEHPLVAYLDSTNNLLKTAYGN